MSANKALDDVKRARNEFAESVMVMIDYMSISEFEKMVNGLPEDITKIILIKIFRKIQRSE